MQSISVYEVYLRYVGQVTNKFLSCVFNDEGGYNCALAEIVLAVVDLDF